MKIVANKISNWISKKVKESNTKGVVLGLSGGLDSSVVAILAKKALRNKVLGLILPCHSDKKDVEDAELIAKKFGIKTEYIDLTPVYDNLIKILPKGEKIAKGNLKPRLRMLILYYFANKLNYLVLGTGNKSELKIGYFTRYGDSGVDLLPIGDLYKTQVIELAKELGIPKEIIEKSPSAGLWSHQRDEDELGMEYKEIDIIIHYLLELKIEPKNVANKSGLSSKKVKRILDLMKKNRFKLEMPEICKL